MLRRLNAIDAHMLYAETPTWHLHVGGVLVVDPSTTSGGLGFGEWKKYLLAHIDQVEPLQRRVVPVPFGLDRPVWVRDREFDLDSHVRHVRLPAPGGRHELAAMIGEFASRKLDRNRPLWEMWYVDGLEDGRVAVLAKVHHAVADGIGAALLLAEFLEVQPDRVIDLQPAAHRPYDRVPSALELFLCGVGSVVRTPFKTLRPLEHTMSSVGKVLELRRQSNSRVPATPFRLPRMSFNRPATTQRCFAFTDVPLRDLQEVKDAFQMTVNDAVLAACTGALRQYLKERGELPNVPLIAAVPVSTRSADETEEFGNKVSGLFATLPTHIADPVERIHAVRQSADDAKRLYASGVEDVLIDWADVPPPIAIAIGVRLLTWTHLAERLPPIFNLLVSNVPGSPVPLYLSGAPVTAIYPLGPVLDDIGLNITILSHVDQVHFGLVSCPELMPDLWSLADRIPEALTELLSVSR